MKDNDRALLALTPAPLPAKAPETPFPDTPECQAAWRAGWNAMHDEASKLTPAPTPAREGVEDVEHAFRRGFRDALATPMANLKIDRDACEDRAWARFIAPTAAQPEEGRGE